MRGDVCMPFDHRILPDTSRALDLIVGDLIASGLTVVVAAGNSNVDACLGSPGRVPEAITVAGSDPNDARLYLDDLRASNYGSCVDIFAPAHLIPSADGTGGTSLKTGTSFAAPFVAGVAALYLQQEPWLTPAMVKSRLLSRSTQSAGLITNPGPGSPNRLLFSLVPVTMGVTSPTVDGPGQYRWTANLTGGIGHPTYQWSRRWMTPDGWLSDWELLGSGSELLLNIYAWEARFEIRVVGGSGTQSATWSQLVSGHCGHPWLACIESTTPGEEVAP